jgi:hypothetical protein
MQLNIFLCVCTSVAALLSSMVLQNLCLYCATTILKLHWSITENSFHYPYLEKVSAMIVHLPLMVKRFLTTPYCIVTFVHLAEWCVQFFNWIPGAIIGTFHEKGAQTFWVCTLRLPLQDNRIVAWKFCHVLHKVLREGHPQVLSHSQRHRREIEDLGKLWVSNGNYVLYLFKDLWQWRLLPTGMWC